MRTAIFCRAGLLALIACTGGATAAYAEDCGCNAVLIPSIEWFTEHKASSLDSLNIMTQETFESLSKSAGGKVTVPIKEVPFTFSANWDQFREWRDKQFKGEKFSSTIEESRTKLRSAVPPENVRMVIPIRPRVFPF